MSKNKNYLATPKAEAFNDEPKEKIEGSLSRQEKAERRQRRGGALLGVDEKKLDRPEYVRGGYQRRWMNDKNGRLDNAYNNDYDFVLKDGEKIKKRVGSKDNGEDLYAFLMEKPVDWYQDDQQKKLERDSRAKAVQSKKAIANASKGVKIYRPDIEDNAAMAEVEVD